MSDRQELLDMLREAEIYLGGFIGSASTYEKVEALRERIREKLRQRDK
jgi:hypothetical protein